MDHHTSRLSRFRALASLALICCVDARAQPTGSSRESAAEVPALASETDLIRSIRDATRGGDFASADGRLNAKSAHSKDISPSVLQVRRAVAACGWLINDNERVRAEQLARRVIERVGRIREVNDEDRVERFYWEAWLESEVLGNRTRALKLLQAAAELAPADPRIVGDLARLRKAQEALAR